MQSRSVLLKNMFDPEECVVSISVFCRGIYSYFPSRESEKDWDKDLADEVKHECEEKYGKVLALTVEKETQVRNAASISAILP